MADAAPRQHAANLDRPGWAVTTVAVNQESDVTAPRPAHGGSQSLGADGSLVLVVAADLADADLEGPRALDVPQACEAIYRCSTVAMMSDWNGATWP